MGIFFTGLLSTVNEGQWFFCLFIYVLTAIGFSGSNLFYDSMLVDVTTEDRMDWISTNGFAYGYIGSTIPFIISIALIMKPQILGFDSAIIPTKLSFIITALWWFIFSIPLLKNVQQVNYLEPCRKPVKESFLRLIKTFKEIKQYKNIFLFLIAFFFYIDGVHTIISMATIFGKDINLSNTTLMVVLLVIQFVAFPFAIIYGKLAQKFSAKIMLFVGIIVYTFVTIYAYFIKSELEFWILGLLVATSQGGIQALSRSLFGKIIPKEKSAEFFGFYNIFGKFAAIFGPLLYGMASQITGNPRFGVLSLIILFIIGGFLMIFVKTQGPSKT
jgi:UMF1 family MFS transporter